MSEVGDIEHELKENARTAFDKLSSERQTVISNGYKPVFEGLKETDEIFVTGEDIKSVSDQNRSARSYCRIMRDLSEMELLERYSRRAASNSKFLTGYTDENHEWRRYDDSHWNEREEIVSDIVSENSEN